MIAKYKEPEDLKTLHDRNIYMCIDQAVKMGIVDKEEAETEKILIAGSEYWDFFGTVEECLNKLSIVLQRATKAIDMYFDKEDKISNEYND